MDRSFALLQELSDPDEALCSSAVEAALRVGRSELARPYMELLGSLRSKSPGIDTQL